MSDEKTPVKREGNILKFLGMGLEGGGELSEMSEENAKAFFEMIKPHITPIMEKFGKPAFASLENEMGNDEKFFVLRKINGIVCFISFDAKKADVTYADDTAILSLKPIQDPAEFMGQLFNGELMKTEGAK